MKIVKYVLLGLLFISVTQTETKAQNQVNISQYMMYQPLLNPSAVGSYNDISAAILHRNQWSGFNGAPKTNMLSVNSPIGKTSLAVGLGFQQEKIGVSNSTAVFANIGYRFKIDRDSYLSTGISLGADFFNLSYGRLLNSDLDPELNYGTKTNNFTNPLARFGVFYFKQNFYVTAYVPNILTPQLSYNGSDVEINTNFNAENLHYYLQSGYRYKYSDNLEMNFSTLLKKSSTYQFDLNAQALINNFIGVGASYRSSQELAILVNVKLMDKLKIGYAYDYALNNLATVSSGSHEIMLVLDLNKEYKQASIQVPRF
jgi:type IX secretion system PorP/SprF family membrane protein